MKKKSPFIIAEMSGNHNHSLERAINIIEAAAWAGVDAVKLQTYTADTLTIDKRDNEFFIGDKNSPWYGESLYELYQKAYTPWEWHEKLFSCCEKLGLICFSTPFDATAIDFLEKLNCPYYKIASFENIDLKLVKKVAQTKKPMIVSTGMASIAELDELVRTARQNGCADLTLLKCVSNYPANPEGFNLRTLPHMQELFKCNVGLSDHTLGIGVSIASVALGATVIEKHFTLSRAEGGVDSSFSMEPQEMAELVRECKAAYKALGEVSYEISSQESKLGRRSLYVVEDMKKGDVLTEKNLRSIRPGYGLEPKYFDDVLGLKVVKDVKRGTALSWDMLK